MAFEYRFGKKKSDTNIPEPTISPEKLAQIRKQMHDLGFKTKNDLEEEVKILKEGNMWLVQENEFLKSKVERLENKVRALKKIYDVVKVEFVDEDLDVENDG